MECFYSSEYLAYDFATFLLEKCNLLLYSPVCLRAKESQDHQDFLYPVLLIHICKNRILIRFCTYKRNNETNKLNQNYHQVIFWYQSYFSFISSNSFRHSLTFTGHRYFKVDPLILFRFLCIWNVWRILIEYMLKWFLFV